MKFGLLGKDLPHSFSKTIHEQIADYAYDLYEKNIEDLEDFIKSDISGFNVTIPYKEEVIKYLDYLSPRAKRIGAVNTIIKRDGKILGYNTDYFGFDYLLQSLGENFTRAIILGDGATSKTIGIVLADKKISYVKLSRKKSPYYADLDKFNDADLLINATPVGMYPNNGKSLIDLDKLPKLKAVVDVIYNPYITEILFEARDRKIKYANGLKMLIGQALEASSIFQNKDLDYKMIEEIEANILKNRNIVLIGMPGSGKSSIGSKLSEKTGKNFVDTDAEIEKIANMPISEIFEKCGEEKFRDLEKSIINKVGKETNQIIATGGGVVKDPANFRPLKQNSLIYFIKRNLSDLDREGRPLSTNYRAIEGIWQERKDFYQLFSDKKIPNISIDQSVELIIGDFYENTFN
ncbi:shikimate kinase [Anaerococcus sp. AGMB09787]|uniref:shikimate kinase n=1 Tax=Anaerococcus sp. AGMB09787 TaxID=2922869 RepID=UPI001FB01638|nr:shikimate kinase [Anaerococcus sp. AGMB09787]